MTIKYKKQSSKRRSFSFILRGNKKYLVSPYAMIIDDGKYFFTGFEDEEKIVKTFRIDKVDSLSITPFDSEPQPKSFNIKKFASQTKMYSSYEIS